MAGLRACCQAAVANADSADRPCGAGLCAGKLPALRCPEHPLFYRHGLPPFVECRV